MTDLDELVAEARLAQCSECSEEGTSAAMRCDGDLIRRLADALEARQPSGDDREALIDVLVMTDLSNYAGTDMGLISQAATAILAAGFSRAAAPAEPEWEYGRRNRETGAIHTLQGDPYDDWWHENQDKYEHVKRYTSPPLPVEGESK